MLSLLTENLVRLYSDETAVTTVEYGLIAALLCAVAAVAAYELSQSSQETMSGSTGYYEGGQ